MVRGRQASVGILAVAMLASARLPAQEPARGAAAVEAAPPAVVPHTDDSVEIDFDKRIQSSGAVTDRGLKMQSTRSVKEPAT